MNIKIAKELIKVARALVADFDYIYDPEHKKHPGGGYRKTEKGWSKLEKKENQGQNVPKTYSVPSTSEDLVKMVSKKINLTKKDKDDLLHDLNNLRGDEWVDVIENSHDKNLSRIFKEFLERQ